MTTTIALTASTRDRAENYGVLLTSETVHQIAGRRVHNSGYLHRIEVWENRPSRANGADPVQLVDPHGRPTEARYTVLTSAQASVISAHPMPRDPEGPALRVDDVVDLTVHGYSIGEFVVTAGYLSDPILVRVSANGLTL